MSTVIMAGALNTFDVSSVLQAVSLSRQYTSIRLWNAARQETGELRVKAGQLLHAAAGELRGKAAFRAIVQSDAHQTFRVERMTEATNLPEPLGPLARLLLDVPPIGATPPRAPAPPASKTVRPGAPNLRPVQSPPPLPTLASLVPQDALDRLTAGVDVLVSISVCNASETVSSSLGDAGSERVASSVAEFVQRFCALQHQLFGSGEVSTLVELGAGVVCVRSVGKDLCAGFLFTRNTSLGMVRFLTSELEGSVRELVSRATASGSFPGTHAHAT